MKTPQEGKLKTKKRQDLQDFTRQLARLEKEIREREAALKSLDAQIEEKEKILNSDFSDIFVPDEWVEGSIFARADFKESYRNTAVVILKKFQTVGFFFKRRKVVEVIVNSISGLYDSESEKKGLEQMQRFAAAINQKILRRQHLRAGVDSPDFDPLAQFKKNLEGQ